MAKPKPHADVGFSEGNFQAYVEDGHEGAVGGVAIATCASGQEIVDAAQRTT